MSQDYSVSELIYYNRPDIQGPKLSVYSKCNVPHGADLLNVLKMALGVKGVVKKTRHLYIHEHTRIHVDIVENLGKFVEIEVCILHFFLRLGDRKKIKTPITSSNFPQIC